MVAAEEAQEHTRRGRMTVVSDTSTVWKDIQGPCDQTGCWAMLWVEYRRATGSLPGDGDTVDSAVAYQCRTRKPSCNETSPDCFMVDLASKEVSRK